MSSLFTELKRRNVFRVGIAYLVVAWLVVQVADVMIDNIGAPDWLFSTILMVLGIGFPVVLVFAWAFELTPEGIKRDSEVDRSQSIVQQTGRKLDRAIIVLLVLVAGYFIWESRFASESAPKRVEDAASQAPEMDTSAEAQVEALKSNLASENSIAVLPFANRSRLEDDLFFTDGIHDDLLTQLAKLDGFKVISRTSVMEYRGTTKKIPEIAAELGVGKILEGGVQRAGNRIRINAQLIDVATDEHLWAETFDREMTLDNVFDIQSEITRQIVTAIRGELSEQELDALTERPTENMEAWEAYQQAKAATLRPDYQMENYFEAQAWAQRAVNFDPNFAEAWALLTEIHGQAVWMGYDQTAQRVADARLALDRAVALKPDSAAVMNAQGEFLYRVENNYAEALQMFQAAHQRAPGDSRILLYLATTQRRMGHWDDAIETYEKALSLDPSNIMLATQLADTLSWMGRNDEVIEFANEWLPRAPDARDLKVIAIDAIIDQTGDLERARELYDQLEPWVGVYFSNAALRLPLLERDYEALIAATQQPQIVEFQKLSGGQAYLTLARGTAYYFMGDATQANELFIEALEEYEAQPEEKPTDRAFQLQSIATALAYLGRTSEALDASRQATELLPRRHDHLFGAYIANQHPWFLAMAGQRDEAIRALQAIERENIQFSRWQLKLDPNWDFFRDDERFNRLANPESVE